MNNNWVRILAFSGARNLFRLLLSIAAQCGMNSALQAQPAACPPCGGPMHLNKYSITCMKLLFNSASALVFFLISLSLAGAQTAAVKMQPRIAGEWWTIAGDPDLGPYTDTKQQPVDFAIWQATDGTWQLWSCIRATQCGGNTRLFHRWEGPDLAQTNWTPRGIAMEAKPELGETRGGLQAPYVVRDDRQYLMFYGDWEHICAAASQDGKRFERRLNAEGKTGLFTQAPGANTRDPMVLFTRGAWHCYYTAYPGRLGADYCRTSTDTLTWSPARMVAFGGVAGTNPYSAECPFVVERTPGEYYLFRTQRYGKEAIARVHYTPDPMESGVNNDAAHLIGSLPVAAPEIFQHQRQWYIASLLPSLKGIRLAKLEWVPVLDPPKEQK